MAHPRLGRLRRSHWVIVPLLLFPVWFYFICDSESLIYNIFQVQSDPNQQLGTVSPVFQYPSSYIDYLLIKYKTLHSLVDRGFRSVAVVRVICFLLLKHTTGLHTIVMEDLIISHQLVPFPTAYSPRSSFLHHFHLH